MEFPERKETPESGETGMDAKPPADWYTGIVFPMQEATPAMFLSSKFDDLFGQEPALLFRQWMHLTFNSLLAGAEKFHPPEEIEEFKKEAANASAELKARTGWTAEQLCDRMIELRETYDATGEAPCKITRL